MEVPSRQLYIGGAWVAPTRHQYLDVVCPATEAVVGKIPAATIEDVESAVAAAAAAYKSGHWSKTSGAYRAKYLKAIAEKVKVARALCQVPAVRVSGCLGCAHWNKGFAWLHFTLPHLTNSRALSYA